LVVVPKTSTYPLPQILSALCWWRPQECAKAWYHEV
jgi:hypothetical protein